jgi:GT2 family glycosyltransferase
MRHLSRRVYNVGEEEYLGGFECPPRNNNMSYRRAALESVGGFDESFPYAGGEDADLKWRLCQNGAQLLYVP